MIRLQLVDYYFFVENARVLLGRSVGNDRGNNFGQGRGIAPGQCFLMCLECIVN